MLSCVINSVEKNPEFLRATVYELARHKLKEEFSSESFGDVRNLSKSLEVAIAGVEAFSKKKDGVEASLLGATCSGEDAHIGPSFKPTCRVRSRVSFPCIRSPRLRIWRDISMEESPPLQGGSVVSRGSRDRACRHIYGGFAATASEQGIPRRQSASASLAESPDRFASGTRIDGNGAKGGGAVASGPMLLASLRLAEASSMNST